jgi:DNA-binding XRE family transcriptional regulator
MKWNDAKQIINSDPEVVKELENNSIEYQVVREIIKARYELNLTQEQLAKLVGTKQSNISRLESGEYNPTIEFLSKVAQAMGKTLRSLSIITLNFCLTMVFSATDGLARIPHGHVSFCFSPIEAL